MSKVVILQSNYIPWKGYFDLIDDADIFIFYDEVKYTKNDWRNRNRICSKNGLHWLTLPIAKDAVKLKISEVTLPESDWQAHQYKSLFLSYKPAPFFSQIEPFLDHFYKSQSFSHLSVFNQEIIRYLCNLIGIPTKIYNSADFELKGDRIEKLIYLLQQVNATEYITGPSGMNYLEGHEGLFLDKNIRLTVKKYPEYPGYKQLGPAFSHQVSIIDLLANVALDQVPNYICSARS